MPLKHAVLSGFQSAGKKTLMAEAADFPASIVTATGLVLMQKPLWPLCNLLPSVFCFLAGLISNVARTSLLLYGR